MNLSDILAGMAIVVALLSAAYSYRLSRRAHRLSAYYGVIGLFRELDKTFVDYPEIRPYFYEGKPVDIDGYGRRRVQAVAELMLDTFEWIWYRQEELNAKGEVGWRTYIMDTFFSSPALQQHYASCARWYPGITRLIADRAHATAGGPADSSGEGGAPG